MKGERNKTGAKTWIPDEILLDKPNVARMYDYFLGGYHNFEVDRMTAEKIIEIVPEVRLNAQANRAFLRRVVHFLTEQGVDQFLDIGSGIPTAGNVHEVAQAANPAARIVYVDIDPVAIAHSRAILEDNPNAIAIRGDARQPDRILNHAEVKRLLDFSQPLAVLLVAILQFVTEDEEAYGAVRTLHDAMAPGSYVAISHPSFEGAASDIYERAAKLYTKSTAQAGERSSAQIRSSSMGLNWLNLGWFVPRFGGRKAPTTFSWTGQNDIWASLEQGAGRRKVKRDA